MELKMAKVEYKGIIPFVIIQLIGLAIICLIPESITSLPKALLGG